MIIPTQATQDADVIVVGAGIGGLVAGGLLARYGKRVIICESHTIPGGAGHSFQRQGFHFDSGPSFHCGLGDPGSFNPLRAVLDILEEPIETIPYDPIGHYHFPEYTLPIHADWSTYFKTIAEYTPAGSQQLATFQHRLQPLFESLSGIPITQLRADWHLIPTLLKSWPSLLKGLPHLPLLQGSVGTLMDQMVQDPLVRRLIDLECFLISGLKAHDTSVPVMAFVFGERGRSPVDYPVGGGGAIIDALVRGLQRWGGQLRLGFHVDRILVKHNQVIGVQLRNGERLKSSTVVCNATGWDLVDSLLDPGVLPEVETRSFHSMPCIDSFMHLHLGIQAEGLEGLTGHHVVVHDSIRDITVPGNTCMISIPSVWDPALAPLGCHCVHVYSLEPFANWSGLSRQDESYQQLKTERAAPLFAALTQVIPNLAERVELSVIGTPLTHARFLRRCNGSYGPQTSPSQLLPGPGTAVSGLYRVGDTTLPGIGVPAVAASGIICANTLVSPDVIPTSV